MFGAATLKARLLYAVQVHGTCSSHLNLSPVHTGDYSRQIRRQIVAVSYDYTHIFISPSGSKRKQ